VVDDFDVMSRSGHWDRTTRRVIEERIATTPTQQLFDDDELRKIEKVIEAVVPGAQENVPIKEVLGREFEGSFRKGVRLVDLPWRPDMYKKGLAFIDEEARERFGKGFLDLSMDEIADLLGKVSLAEVKDGIWEFPPDLFFRTIVEDIVAIYYSFPQSWNEIKFAGPAYPYGYYQLGCKGRMWYEPELEEGTHG
jgi:hypothetical protein